MLLWIKSSHSAATAMSALPLKADIFDVSGMSGLQADVPFVSLQAISTDARPVYFMDLGTVPALGGPPALIVSALFFFPETDRYFSSTRGD
jgi:hypothetical protein